MMNKILCLSPNTNVESTWVLPDLRLGGVYRSPRVTYLASGKGVNVCRALRRLGGDGLALGFAAGRLGRWFADLAEREGLPGEWTWVEGEGRQALVLYDPHSSGDATLLSSPGPAVSAGDWDRLQAAALSQAPAVAAVSISGSLPPGSPLSSYTGLIRALAEAGKPVWVDADGPVLEAALGAHPAGVKINAREAQGLLGMPVWDAASAGAAARRIQALGIARVVVTLGAGGAVLGSDEGLWFAAAAPLPHFHNSVGSGDAFLAGLLLGLASEQGLPAALRMAAAAGEANAMTPGGGCLDFQDYQALLPNVIVASLNPASS
jgi:1-phosphofructokinase family hexose kinase